jgi:aminoglycoside phosphotransferase (APT) family kinase protein
LRAETIPVREAHRFDPVRLEAYVAAHVPELAEHLARVEAAPGGRLGIEQFSGGQSNPTYLVTLGDSRVVLRRKPPGKLLPSAHAVDREYRVIRALAGSAVPVPRAIAYCDDATVIGTAFYLMEHVDGRVYRTHDLPGLEPEQRAGIYDELNRVIAELHSVDPAALGLADFGRPGNYCARQIARWTKQYRASADERIDAMEHLIDWLPAHAPEVEPFGLTHGDYRLDNVVFSAHEPKILAVIDWELATLGNPLADFCYGCIGWHLPERLAGRDLDTLGIPAEADYVRAYCRRTGIEQIPDFDFYIAFGMFRLAAILAGIAARARAGNAASAQAEAAGRRARPMAEAAWLHVSQHH